MSDVIDDVALFERTASYYMQRMRNASKQTSNARMREMLGDEEHMKSKTRRSAKLKRIRVEKRRK